jgi:hypothetical protein
MNKNRTEPIGVIMHLYMEMSQGNSLCNYLKPAKMSIFFFYKIREREGATGPAQGGRLVQVGGRGCGRERAQEGEHGANTVCTCVKWKNATG